MLLVETNSSWRRSSFLLLSAALWGMTSTALATGRPAHRVLLAETQSRTLDAEALAAIPELIAGELRDAGGYQLAELGDDLTQELRVCRAELACLTKVAAKVRADTIVTSTMTTEGRVYRLEVSLTPVGAAGALRESETMRQLKSIPMNVKLCLTRLLKGDESRPTGQVAAEAPVPPLRSADKPVAPSASAAPAPQPEAAPVEVAAGTAAPQGRVMVLELKANGIDTTVATRVSAATTQEIARHPGYDVASAAEVAELLALDKTRQLVGCESDAACVSEITRKLNADLIVTGSLGQLGTSYVLSLALLDAHSPGGARRATDTFDSAGAMETGVPATLAKLFGWGGQGAAVPRFHLKRGQKLSFAVFDLNATGVSPEVAKNLTQVLSSEVKNVEGTSVVSRDDIMALLQFDKQKNELGCTEDTACIAEIGGALGVDRLVVGSIGKVSEDYVIALRLIDARHATVENRYTEFFRSSEDQLIGATRHAGRQLLGLDHAADGKLAITASQPAAEVFLDNEKQGLLPLPPVEKLTPGRHSLRLAKDGFFDWQADIYVNPYETTGAWAQLKERPEKWYQKWWVWTAAGVVVAGTTVGILYATRTTTATGTVSFR